MNKTLTQVLTNLRNNLEGVTITEKNGDVWGSVYLDNARPAGMSATAFRSCLSGLSKLNLYKVDDGENFGLVKLEKK